MKTATLAGRKTRSAVRRNSGRGRVATRNRRPRRCTDDRTTSSGFVSRLLFATIVRRTASLDAHESDSAFDVGLASGDTQGTRLVCPIAAFDRAAAARHDTAPSFMPFQRARIGASRSDASSVHGSKRGVGATTMIFGLLCCAQRFYVVVCQWPLGPRRVLGGGRSRYVYPPSAQRAARILASTCRVRARRQNKEAANG